MIKHNHKNTENKLFLFLNLSVIGVCLFFTLFYVVLANTIASKDYKIKDFQAKIQTLSEKNVILSSQKMALEVPAKLIEFASSKNLIEAKDILYIFENKNVAKR